MDNEEIRALRAWFKAVELPEGDIVLGPGVRVVDLKMFLNSHFKALGVLGEDAANYQPVISRLRTVKRILERKNFQKGIYVKKGEDYD